MFYANIENKKINGFCIENLHGLDLCNQIYANGGIKINEELWQYILSLGEVEFNGVKEDREYTMADKDLFTQVVNVPEDNSTPVEPSIYDRMTALESALMEVL